MARKIIEFSRELSAEPAKGPNDEGVGVSVMGVIALACIVYTLLRVTGLID